MEYAWKHKDNVITKPESGENGILIIVQLSFRLKTEFTGHGKCRKEMQRIPAHSSTHSCLRC